MWIFKAQKRFFSTGVEKKGGKMNFLKVSGRLGQELQFIWFPSERIWFKA